MKKLLDFNRKLIFHFAVYMLYFDVYDTLLQFFGGTNFGRTAGGPLYITSYDYDAPIDEYGRHQ